MKPKEKRKKNPNSKVSVPSSKWKWFEMKLEVSLFMEKTKQTKQFKTDVGLIIGYKMDDNDSLASLQSEAVYC